MVDTLSAAEARRTFLAAQSLASTRRSRVPKERDFRDYLARQGVLQLDSVNVFARAHYLPLFSRLGAYDRDRLDSYLWGGGEAFEHWGHEASVMPRDLLPALHHRMSRTTSWKIRSRETLERERPGLLDEVTAEVRRGGPLVAADIEHLAPREGRKGSWWDHGHVKTALEYLFITGEVAAARGRHFTRTYDDPERAWGLPPASRGDWGLAEDEAHQALFDRAIAACGVSTPRDLADHFRLMSPAGGNAETAARWAESAVERGLAAWVHVEGWREPALLAAGATAPARATGAALLSPFDPVCWYRPRLERMFGVEYRIEIYTPEPKRQYGYYCLPFLLGDSIVARVDLKADRKAGALLAQATWREPRLGVGARRRPDGEVAEALARELRTAAGWLGLERVDVVPKGDLADALRAACRTTSADVPAQLV